MKNRFSVTLLIVAFLFAIPHRAEAREPYYGKYKGEEDRTVEKAKPKKKKLKAKAAIVQSGPSSYDAQTTIDASADGEKIKIILNLDSANNGTLTINGTVVAGPGSRSRHAQAAEKKLKIALKATGTATFVGPLRQTITMTGKSGNIPFTVAGIMDLDASGGLILNLNVTFSKPTTLGKKASFAFNGPKG